MSIKELDKLDIEYVRTSDWVGKIPDRKQLDGPWVQSVFLDLTPEDWCRLCMREGEDYFGGCCGQMSHFQDALNGFFRDGGWVRAGKFLDAIEGAKTHEGFEMFEDESYLTKDHSKWKTDYEPLDKMAVIYHAVKDVSTPHLSDWISSGNRLDLDTLKGCTTSLEKALRIVYWRDLLSVWSASDEEGAHQRRMNSSVELARVYAPLKKLYEKLVMDPPEAISGFAVVDPEGNVTKNGRGLVIVESKKAAEDMIEFWKRDGQDHRLKVIEALSIRECIVTIQDGLLLYETVTDEPDT